MSTITVVPTVENSTGPTDPPRIRLDVTDTGSPNRFAATVVRNDPDGRQVPVRTSDGNPLVLSTSGSDRIGLVYDYEAPLGQSVTYTTLESPGTVSGSVSVDDSSAWLIHPGVPSLSMPIEFSIGSADEETWAVSQGVFYPMGRSYPIVVSGGARRAPQSVLILILESLEDLERLRSLLADASVLMINVPWSLSLGILTSYIAISDVTISRPSSVGSEEVRKVSLPFAAATRPAGGTTSERTYADLLDFATYGDLAAGYASYLDLLAGP